MATIDQHHTSETMPPTSTHATSPEAARRRTGWVIAITLAALAVLILVVLYAIDVL